MFELLMDLFGTLARVSYYTAEYLFCSVFPSRKSVQDEVVLITGGGSGIGRLMALRFADLRAVVVLWDIDVTSAKKVAKEIQLNGHRAKGYGVDVTDTEAVYKTAKAVADEVGTVTILVNNAGVVSGKKILDIPDDKIKRTFAINTTSHFWTVKSFLPAMLEADHGHVVTIASISGLIGAPNQTDYSASKFACVGFNESLRQELAVMGKTGVNTTVVCPYFISTGMFDGCQSKIPWLTPILSPEKAADQIVDAVLCNTHMLIMPLILHAQFLVRALFPTKAIDELNKFLGAHKGMEDFKGRT